MQFRDLFHETLDRVEMFHRTGLISDATMRRYATLWTWGAYRFSDPAVELQHRHARRFGEQALADRVGRIRNWVVYGSHRKPHVRGA